MTQASSRGRLAIEVLLVVVTLGTLSYVANAWILHQDNFFGLDDFDWFWLIQQKQGEALFSFFPQSLYNDRPIGAIFIRFLRGRFEWDHVGHHQMLWTVHLFNACLVYWFARQLLERLEAAGPQRIVAWIAAAVFVAWPTSMLAPSWDAAAFDLLGATFLLSFLVVAMSMSDPRLFGFHAILMFGLLWLGLRTKETLIVAPFIGVAIAVAIVLSARWRGADDTRPLFVRAVLPFCAVSIFYYALLRLQNSGGFGTDPTNPYFQSFAPRVLLSNLATYVQLFFDGGIPDNLVTPVTGRRYLYFALPAFVGIVAVWQLFRRRGLAVAVCILLAAMMIAPVLPMKNMQHRLYLYMPSVFVGLAIAAAIGFASRSLPRLRVPIQLVAAAVLAGGMIWGGRGSDVWIFRNWWHEIGRENSAVFKQLFELPKFPEDARVAVVNVSEHMLTVSVLAPGEGEVLRLLDHDESVKVTIYPGEVPADVDPKPTHVIDYNKAQLVLRPSAPSSEK